MADFTADVAQLQSVQAELKKLGGQVDVTAARIQRVGQGLSDIKSLASKGYTTKVATVASAIRKVAQSTDSAAARMERITETYSHCEQKVKACVASTSAGKAAGVSATLSSDGTEVLAAGVVGLASLLGGKPLVTDTNMFSSIYSLIGDSVGSWGLSDKARNCLVRLRDFFQSNTSDSPFDRFFLNLAQSYASDGIDVLEDVEHIASFKTDPWGYAKSVFSITTKALKKASVSIPSFIPDAIERNGARRKIANELLTAVQEDYGTGWATAAVVPAAFYELGGFIVDEVPRCAWYAAKASSPVVGVVETIADTFHRGVVGEKMPNPGDTVSGVLDTTARVCTSALTRLFI